MVMDYRELYRLQKMKAMYERMSPEDQRAYVQLTAQQRDHQEVMQTLEGLGQKADANHHSWVKDFGANIAGNAVWDSLVWVGSRIISKL